jgi:hypothetical protein
MPLVHLGDPKEDYIQQRKQLAAMPSLEKIATEFDMPLIPVLYQMEKEGAQSPDQGKDTNAERDAGDQKAVIQKTAAAPCQKIGKKDPGKIGGSEPENVRDVFHRRIAKSPFVDIPEDKQCQNRQGHGPQGPQAGTGVPGPDVISGQQKDLPASRPRRNGKMFMDHMFSLFLLSFLYPEYLIEAPAQVIEPLPGPAAFKEKAEKAHLPS